LQNNKKTLKKRGKEKEKRTSDYQNREWSSGGVSLAIAFLFVP